MRLWPCLALALLLAACGGGATPQVALAPATPSPQPSPTPPPRLTVRGPLRQGAAFLVALRPAPQGPLEVAFAQASYPMTREGEGAVAFVPIPPDLAPGPYTVAVRAGARLLATAEIEVAPYPFAEEELRLPAQALALLQDAQAVGEEAQALARAFSRSLPFRAWTEAWALPVAGEVSDPFGTLRSLGGGDYSRHTGVDIAAPAGTPVVAAAPGVVVLARTLHLRGLSVVIDHGAGVFTGYHHLGEIAVREGQWVGRGQTIGWVGETGLAAGPHLHWELVVHGVRVDPLAWLGGPPQP